MRLIAKNHNNHTNHKNQSSDNGEVVLFRKFGVKSIREFLKTTDLFLLTTEDTENTERKNLYLFNSVSV
jgi:hypothetical protein